MNFSDVLRDVTDEVKGATSAFIAGMDGIVVDEFSVEPGGMDISSVCAEYGSVLKEVQNAADSLKMGNTAEVVVLTDSVDLILRKINDEYFLALVMLPNGNFGKGRFKVRTTAYRLSSEF